MPFRRRIATIVPIVVTLWWLTRSSQPRPLPKVHLFLPIDHAFAQNRSVGFCQVLESAAVNGWEPTVINWDDDGKRAHVKKINGLHNVITSSSLSAGFSDRDLIMMVDARDCWLQLPPETMAKRFVEDFDGNVVVSAEKNCWPQFAHERACLAAPESPLPLDLFYLSPDSKGTQLSEQRPRWVNSGTVIGRLPDMRRLYTGLVEALRVDTWEGFGFVKESDQRLFNEMLGTKNFTLDYHHRLFWPANEDEHNAVFISSYRSSDGLAGSLPWNLHPTHIWHKLFGHAPVAVHFNGGAKTAQDAWWPQMWWRSRRLRAVAVARMFEATVKFQTGNGFITKGLREVCPKLDAWEEGLV